MCSSMDPACTRGYVRDDGSAGEIAAIESLALELIDDFDMSDRWTNTEFDCSPSVVDDGQSFVDQSDAAPALLRHRSFDMGPSRLSDAASSLDMSAFAVDGVYDRKLAMDELDDWLINTGFEDKTESERQDRGITRGEAQPSPETQQHFPSRNDRGRLLPPVKAKEIEARTNYRRMSIDELDDWLHDTSFREETELGRWSSEPDTTATSRGVKRRQVARRNMSASVEATETDFYRPRRQKKLRLKSAAPTPVPVYETHEHTCSRYFPGVMAERGEDVPLPQVRLDRRAPGNADWLPRPQASPPRKCLYEHQRQLLHKIGQDILQQDQVSHDHQRQLLHKIGQDILRQDQVSRHVLRKTHRSMLGLSSGSEGQTGLVRGSGLRAQSF